MDYGLLSYLSFFNKENSELKFPWNQCIHITASPLVTFKMSSEPQPTPNPFIKQGPEREPELPAAMDLDNDNDNDNGNDDDDPNHNHSYSFKDGDGDGDGDVDRDTDEIRSLDSDELRETRPNRWRGHPSTWRAWTERERRAWSALDNARRADLAVHLYNAFGLREGLREAPEVLDEVSISFSFLWWRGDGADDHTVVLGRWQWGLEAWRALDGVADEGRRGAE